ncbi:MAG TPA: tetratricopeptide repeat protein [Methylocystis sp.]|nr:tetratricopeptide repeat protein [Methylocystis sp.]
MPYATIMLLVNAGLILHAIRTGRFWPWFWVILMLPGIGALAYVVMELAPEFMGSRQARVAQSQLSRAVDPTRRYRELKDNLAITDTIMNRVDLARECLDLEKYEEALTILSGVVAHPQGDEPTFFVDKARAEFGLAKYAEALATLDELKRHWPDYQSNDGHLLYARVLEELRRDEEAEREYRALAPSYPGVEPRVRLARLLQRSGSSEEAKTLAQSVVTELRRSPKHVVKAQSEWLKQAEGIARS